MFLRGMSSIPVAGLLCGIPLFAQDKDGFPDGFDAVQVAPDSHKVLFENAFVRVLQVQVAPGTKEPMHHHRWPSMFLSWDTGGHIGHQRIYHMDGSVHDTPSHETPVTPGMWRVKWMKPEPMHSVENLEAPESAATAPKKPPTIRVEFKYTAS
ncbi:MAG TPA: hypothetical protein VFA99_02210 [Acidobacteriaceae bacterium]|nr:hypothetical protein [Acidobacteriaceae bacterium]